MKNRQIMWRKLSKVILAFMLMVLFSGCVTGHMTSERKKLTVYVLDMSPNRWIECDVWSFNFPNFEQAHDDIEIVTVSFSTIEALEEQLLRELSNGGGPDVILYSWQNSFDIYKLAAAGLFVDLNTFLTEDATYHREDYIESLLDCGVIDGGQYLMPVGYTVPLLLTSQEKLADAGVAYTGEALSGRELLQLVVAESERLADVDDRFAFIDFQQGNAGMTFFEYSGLIHLDYETNTASVDSDEFYELMQNYTPFAGELNRSLYALTNNGPGTGYTVSAENLLEVGTVFHATFNPLQEILYHTSSMTFSLNETPVIQIQTSFHSADSYCVDPLIAAVNRNSAETEAAYMLVRYLMDHPVQQGKDGIVPGSYFSIHKDATIDSLHSFLQTLNPNDNSAWDTIGQQLEDIFNDFLNSKVVCCMPRALSNSIDFQPCLKAASESRAAFDATVDAMLAEVESYLNRTDIYK